MLEISHLVKKFGPFTAVDDVSFGVAEGEVLGFLGPNGAGKSTTMKMITGFLAPTSGTAVVCGHDIEAAPLAAKRRIGYLPEGAPAYPDMTAAEFLDFIAHIRGLRGAEARRRIFYIADLIHIGDVMHQPIETLSKGYRRRVGVAQALLHDPSVLILDEPTDGLDPPQIAEMRRVLRRYATGGRAVLVSSHMLAEVEQTCSHVVIVHRGQVAAAGPVDEVVGDSPSVRFDVSDPGAATEVLRRAGVERVDREGEGTLVADLDGTPRAAVVAALVEAGVDVYRVVPRRRLEDAFLALVGGDAAGGGDR